MDPTAQTQTTLDALTARLAALEAAHTRQRNEQTRRHEERATRSAWWPSNMTTRGCVTRWRRCARRVRRGLAVTHSKCYILFTNSLALLYAARTSRTPLQA